MDECSLWQFGQAIEGFRKANSSGDESSAPSDDEYRAAIEHFEKTGKGPSNANVSEAMKQHISPTA